MGRIRERNERLGICICRLFVCFLLDRFIGLYIDIRVSHSCCSSLSITSGAHGIGTGKKIIIIPGVPICILLFFETRHWL